MNIFYGTSIINRLAGDLFAVWSFKGKNKAKSAESVDCMGN